MNTKRTVFHLVPSAQPKGWAVTVEGTRIRISSKKELLNNWAIGLCRDLERFGVRSQLVVHGKDGQIMTEYTYLNDPPEKIG